MRWCPPTEDFWNAPHSCPRPGRLVPSSSPPQEALLHIVSPQPPQDPSPPLLGCYGQRSPHVVGHVTDAVVQASEDTAAAAGKSRAEPPSHQRTEAGPGCPSVRARSGL